MNREHWILAACWFAFGVIHSVTASIHFKKLADGLAGKLFKYYRIVYSLIALFTLLPILWFQFSIHSLQLFLPGPIVIIISLITALAAIASMAFCIRQYFFRLSGIAAITKSAADNSLKKDGLNRYMRHPLYAATLLLLWSLFLLFPLLSNLVTCIAVTVYTLLGIYLEEKKLMSAFGVEYEHYKRSVPMLIPTFRKQYKNK